MAGKFMKIKRLVIPMLVLIAILAQTTPAFAMDASAMAELIASNPAVTMEYAEVDAITGAAPIVTDNHDGTFTYDKTGLIVNDQNEKVGQVAPSASMSAELTMLASNTSAQIRDIAQFTDYTKDLGYGTLSTHWAKDHIQTLLTMNGIKGNSDGSFTANRSITTAELLSIILNTSGNTPDASKAWPERIMDKALELNLIPASMADEGNVAITREKMALVLVNTATQIRNEDTSKLAETSNSRITDLNQADSAYKTYIKQAYALGLLEGTDAGTYKPKSPTTRGETCVIICRLFEYTARAEVKENLPAKQEGLTAAPDGSNVGSITGTIYPKEGDVINGVTLTRDSTTGVLGFGNGQKGGIYLGLSIGGSGRVIQVGSNQTSDGYDHVNGTYEKKGDYVYWTQEWNMIQGAGMEKVQTISNPTNGMKADIHGNLIKSGSSETAFYLFNGDYWESLQ